jgi:hypothetical protein
VKASGLAIGHKPLMIKVNAYQVALCGLMLLIFAFCFWVAIAH